MRRNPLSRRKSLSISFAAAIERSVVFPRLQAGAPGRHHGNPSEIQSQLACLIVLIGAVHQQRQRQRLGQWPQTTEQLAALLGVVRLASRESKGYRRSSICGNHMKSWWSIRRGICRSLADRFFLTRPLPSG